MYRSIGLITLLTGVMAADVALTRTARVNLPLRVKPGESYEALLNRASKEAGNVINRNFGNPANNRINLLVTAENEGTIAPIMTIDVSRQNWRAEPKIDRWANVLPYAKDLLGFGTPPVAPVNTPRPVPAAKPSPSPSPNPIPLQGNPDPVEEKPPVPLPNQRLRLP